MHRNVALPALLFVDIQAERAQKGSAAFELCQVLAGSLSDQEGCLSARGGEDALCSSAYLT